MKCMVIQNSEQVKSWWLTTETYNVYFLLLQHEEASVKMFDYLVEKNDLIPEFEKYGLTEQDRMFIKEQIAGPKKEGIQVK